MARTPIYPDIPVPHDLDSAIEAVKKLKQAVEALTGSTSQVGNANKAAPADTGAVARVWITRKDNVGAPPPEGMFDGDQWFLEPNGDGIDPWIKLVWLRGSWVTMTP